MFIIPLLWNRSNLEALRDTNDVFNLLMKDSTQPCYLILQGNTLTWVGQGTVPGKTAYQIRARSTTMNEPMDHQKKVWEDLGNVGFFGKYSSIDDAIQKVFPKEGYCVSNMKFTEYSGQKLKGHKYHYSVIEPLLCLMGSRPNTVRMEAFFKTLGITKKEHFHCSGTWNYDMELFVDSRRAQTLEIWFSYFCSKTLF